MSQRTNRLFDRWKNLESQIRGQLSKCNLRGKPLGSQQSTICDAFTCMLVLWDDCYSAVSAEEALPDYQRWLNLFSAQPDIGEWLDILKDASDLLVKTTMWDRSASYADFKHQLNVKHPLAGAVLGPIKRLLAKAIERPIDLFAFRAAFTALRFLRKLTIVDDRLEQKALEGYLAIEAAPDPELTELEAEIIASWFPRSDRDLAMQDFRPKHGNGSTADAGSDICQKYLNLGSDQLLEYWLRDVDVDLFPYRFERTSKTVFVPKTYASKRTISMEPATLMWYQQGLSRAIRRYSSRRYLGRRFTPEDQGPNRRLCQVGSVQEDENSPCTIDLSAASDSVRLQHVKTWFRDSWLYPGLIATRSTHTVLPTGEKIQLRKFAPMGSAVNFDVEVIVFCAIVEAAIRQSGADPAQSKYRVYGDDIIVEKKFFDSVCDRLERNGFTVNREKSFSHTGPYQFRESCGSFFLNDLDISPLQISRRFDSFRGPAARWVPAAIDLANQSAMHPNGRYLRMWVLRKILRLPKKLLPCFSKDGAIGLWSSTPTNFHLMRVYDPDYQEDIYVAGVNKPERGRYPESMSDILLYEWLRRATERPELSPVERVIDPDGSLITVPSPCGKTTKGSRWVSTKLPSFVVDS